MNYLPLNKVANFINGKAFKPSEWEDSGLPIIRIQNLTGTSSEFNYYSGDFKERYRVRDGDILISWSASLGVYVWRGEDAILNQHIFRVETNSKVDKIYFYYAVQSVLDEMKSEVHGTTMQHITKGRFEALKVPVPPIEEQRRIAGILARADRLRQMRRYALQLSDTYLQSVFLRMFGDPVTNPMGWEKRPLGKLLATSPQNGLYVPKDQYVNGETAGGTEMVHMSDLFYEIVRRGNLKRVSISKSDIKKYSLNHQDLLIARRSLNFEGAAKPCLIPESDEPLVFESSMIRITVERKKLLPIYLYYFLSNDRAKKAYVLKYVTRSTISGINQDGLKRLEILVPSMSKQKDFESVVYQYNQLRVQQSEALRQADHLFDTLLHRAFTSNKS